jgi:hypothetical protein
METRKTRPGPNELLPCGSGSARRRHLAHSRPCQVCWPAGGLPAMPDTTAGPDWLTVLIAAEFPDDTPAEFAA